MSNTHSIVAIVGRPNVGKSTLFNRLVGNRSAIVEKTPGVTRDRNYGVSKYHGFEFIVIDTGGFEPVGETSSLTHKMAEQTSLAISEADCVLFLVSVKDGWTHEDVEIYRTLAEKVKSTLYVVVNKVDNKRLEIESYDLYRLGVKKIFPISSEHNRGIDGLLEEINLQIPLKIEHKKNFLRNQILQKNLIATTVVGKPNAGKSSIINALLGKNRMIVDSISGTTRDSVDSLCRFQGKNILLVDTAGIRRRGKVRKNFETFSIVSALKSIEKSDIVLLVIDAEEGVTDQVMKIAGYVNERKKSIIILMNKSDLVKKHCKTLKNFEEELNYRLRFIKFAPILFVSAKTGEGIKIIFEKIIAVYGQYVRRIQTSDLNSILEFIVSSHPPPTKSGRPTKVFYGNQVSVAPPTFVFFTNNPDKTNFSYERYFSNQFRHHFGFEGTPINFIWKKKNSMKNK